MERTDILDLMGTLKLYGMRLAYDEVMATGIKRQHEPPRILGNLLKAEIAEKQARSIKYQLTIARLPLAKDIDDFAFAGTPINERLVRELATGAFLVQQRNAVLIGGTGTGKSHVAIAIAMQLENLLPAVAPMFGSGLAKEDGELLLHRLGKPGQARHRGQCLAGIDSHGHAQDARGAGVAQHDPPLVVEHDDP